jgi:N6-L-threonylcarbamoyladenine synthase
VPELAARAHVELLPRLVARGLEAAGVTGRDLTGIAVTRAPGLVGSLVVGVAFAKAYAFALDLPVAGVNHIEAHLHSATLEHGESPWPALGLVVSGGHTELVLVHGFGRYRWLGSTRDDAAGEAFDKVAKRLGLGFPGGPAIDRLAREGDPRAFDFPRPMLDQPGFDFSFSGLKTAVSQTIDRHGASPSASFASDIAASFQAAMVETLAARTFAALDATSARALSLGGGVACNRGLREALAAGCERRGIPLRVPSPRFCADNAAMIALVGDWLLASRPSSEQELEVVASLEESGLAGSALPA